MTTAEAVNWQEYLDGFHAQHAGITEAMLGRAVDGASDPYGWLVDAVPAQGRVLDLASGSGPLHTLASRGQGYVGLDRSAAEVAKADRQARGPLVLGDASQLPFGDGCFDSVVCSMALMLLTPTGAVLGEVARVLRPQGTLAATLPSNWPMRLSECLRLCHLCLALGHHRPQWPNPGGNGQLLKDLAAAGFSVSSSTARRFRFWLCDPADDDLVVDAFYLPALSPEGRARGRAVARGWRRRGIPLALPLRRITATKETKLTID